jgi:RHS repeat-associated protein
MFRLISVHSLFAEEFMRLTAVRCFATITMLLLVNAIVCSAQDLSGLEQGIKPYGSYHGGDIDSISMVNGNLTLHIPLISYPQRGGTLHFGFSIAYNNQVLQPYANCNPYTHICSSEGYRNPFPGIQIIPDAVPGFNDVPDSSGLTAQYYNVLDPDFGVHKTKGVNASPVYYMTLDTTGYRFQPNSSSSSDQTGTLWDRNGTEYLMTAWTASTIQDINGNYMSATSNSNGNQISWTDTLGRVLPLYNFSPTTTDYSNCTGSQPTTRAYLWTLPGPNGGTSQFKVCEASFPLSFTAPGCTGNCQPNTGSMPWAIQSIVLPNNTAWTFEYDNTGALSQITLPTGGTISYAWTFTSGQCVGPLFDAAGNGISNLWPLGRAITSRTVNANDGTGTHAWTYALSPTNSGSGQSAQTIVTDPLGNDTTHYETYQANCGCSLYESQLDQYSGSHTGGTLLKRTQTIYSANSFSFPNGGYSPFNLPLAGNVVPTSITYTDFVSGMVSKVSKTYDSGVSGVIFGDVLTENDYDFGNGSAGPSLRQTNSNYMVFTAPVGYNQSASKYFWNNQLSLPYTTQVQSGNGTQVSLTQYNYDETALASSGLTSSYQYRSQYANSYRGNNTSIYRWLNSGTFSCPNGNSGGSGGYLKSNKTYFDDGMLNTAADPCGNATTYAYNLTYWGALPTTITNALNQSTTNTYDFNTGLLTSTTDPNNLTTNYGPYDSMWRLTQVNNPDGGWTKYCYTDGVPANCSSGNAGNHAFAVVVSKAINLSQTEISTAVLDGLTRTSQTQLNSDPQSVVYTDTTYDALGRVSTVSNPYRSGTDPTSSPGTTTYGYDALSRKITVTYPDNSVLNTAYCGPSTLVTDPTLKWRRSRINGLGQLVEVDEPNSPTASVASTGCPGTGEPIWVTSYTNDALGNLTQVVQNGSHTRTFTFDSLSRLLTSSNPETSLITYTYNPDSTLLTKTDARNITTSYTYDALLRGKGVSYSNSDPSLAYNYDETNCLGLTACQNIGHRTSMTDAAGSEIWAYQVDQPNLRSIHQEQRTNNSSPSNITKTTTYYMNLAGGVTQLVYPTGRTVNYTYDSADRPSTAVDSSNGITYATDWKTPPSGCLANAACYTPQGSAYAVSLGQSTSFNGINVSESFNSRLQPNEIKASASYGNAMDLTYNFVDPTSGKNAGHVYSITNNLNSARSQTFAYDQLNRILSAGTSATTGTYCWGYQFSYDPYGNLLSQAGWSPTYNACTESTMATVTADGSNHISGLSYDPSGNTLTDGNYTYTWDGESQIKTAGGVTYSYDGDGRRAAKVGSKLYWYGSGGEVLSETDAAGNVQNEYVFFSGKRVALMLSNGDKRYYVEDSLGTSRVVAGTGSVCYDADFPPFGQERAYTNTCSQNYKFEGKERDTETQNDDFGAREYSWRFGRWLSSDWSSVPVPVPYANLSNPQTLNLYAMVSDDPESFADLDGHCPGCVFAGAELLTDSAPELILSGPVGWGVLATGAIAVTGYAVYQHYHQSNDESQSAPPPSSTNNQTPSRTAQDELPRDANGRPVTDAEATGAAHTQLGTRQSRSKPGTSYPQSREFDKDGKPVKDIDHTDHGRSDHTDPHQHPYDPNTGQRLPQEPVKPVPPPPPPPPPKLPTTPIPK